MVYTRNSKDSNVSERWKRIKAEEEKRMAQQAEEHERKNREERREEQRIRQTALSLETNIKDALNSTDEFLLENYLKQYLNLSATQKGYIDTDLHTLLTNRIKKIRKNKIEAENYNLKLISVPTAKLDKSFFKSYNSLDSEVKDLIDENTYRNRHSEYLMYEKAVDIDNQIAKLQNNKIDFTTKYNIRKLREAYDALAGKEYVKNLDILLRIEKTIALDQLKSTKLTPENLTEISANVAAQNNADWVKIANFVNNSQKLITILGFLNTTNNGILPDYVGETGDSYIFTSMKTSDTKKEVGLYVVSKNGDGLKYFEDISKVDFNLVDEVSINTGAIKINSEGKTDIEASLISKTITQQKDDDKSIEKYDVFNPDELLCLGAKAEILKSEVFRKESNYEIKLDESGGVLVGGYLSQKLGWDSGASAEVKTDGINAKASIEGYSVEVGWQPHNKPLMQINDDMSVTFKQQKLDVSLEGGAKIEGGIAFSSKTAQIKLPLLSFKAGVESPDIDGALKQVPTQVSAKIIMSSAENSNVVPITKKMDIPSYAKDRKDRDIYVIDEGKTKDMVNSYKEYFIKNINL